jgi:transcriptional regulator with XRE-family HTH domain
MDSEEFARRLDMDPAFLSRLEREKQRPSVETLTRLLNVLGICVRDLDDAMRMARQEDVPREVTGSQLVEGTSTVNQQLHELALKVAKVMERRRNKQTP